jgi:Pyruvate/2-oxoacid:ferredoxin oxidoreductase delta subunit
MIDPQQLAYDYDEERLGFEEPPRVAAPCIADGQRVGVFLLALGLLSLAIQLSSGKLLGSWLGFLAAALPLATGALLFIWYGYTGSEAGIQNDGIHFSAAKSRGWIGWALGIAITGFYVALYWYPDSMSAAVRWVDPLARSISGSAADRWFLYGFLYTMAVLIFGARMMLRYRHNQYEQLRTLSVGFFQLGLAFVLPQLLKAFQQPEHYFTYFWPLKPEYLYPWKVKELLAMPGGVGVFMFAFSATMTAVVTPVLTYYFGKRWYCSWVCGCGGLAETLGDPWRQLSSKSTLSWKIERGIIYSVLGLVVLTTLVLWINAQSSGRLFAGFSGRLAAWYGFYIGALFSGVIGVGFYPILGSRVWCRFGCPMAAILGILQRFFSRFRITTNGDQCMSCGNCSTYCEMGIDVRAYAQSGKNIVRSSCVGCGICAAVCPRGVLKLENGADFRDRYPESDRPLDAMLAAIRAAKPYE